MPDSRRGWRRRAYRGAIALFVQGCGGDANPLPRIMSSDSPEAIELARAYGKILARAVDLVLKGKMTPIDGPLRTAYAVIQVPFRTPPTQAMLQARLAQATGPKRRQIQYLLTKLEREGSFPTRSISHSGVAHRLQSDLHRPDR